MIDNVKPVKACDIDFNYVRTGRGKEPLSPTKLEDRILSRIKSEGLSLEYKGFLGEYKATNTRIVLLCECGKERNITAKQFLFTSSACPCKRSRYGNKYKKSKHYLYVMRSDNIGKVGVSSNILERRRQLNSRNSRNFEIVFVHEFNDKKAAFDAETFIKREFKTGQIDLNCGKTETFFYSDKTLKSIKNLSSIF